MHFNFCQSTGKRTNRPNQETHYGFRKKKKIAVILPLAYSGGSLRGACLLAEALLEGSKQAQEDAEIVLLCLAEQQYYNADLLAKLATEIKIRQYSWEFLDASAAQKAMIYAGHKDWSPTESLYAVINDEMNYLMDCDLWLFISDRVQAAILPLRPYMMMIYDYIQRYIPKVCPDDRLLISAAQKANAVMTTTEQTYQDALHYASIEIEKLHKMPMLVPRFTRVSPSKSKERQQYFLWTTNLAMHKNHSNAFLALVHYYEELNGQLKCYISGVNTSKIAEQSAIAEILHAHPDIQAMIQAFDNVLENEYTELLSNAAFLWHTALIDNGTFSVIEAGQMNVPSLSSDYPAMHEIDEQFDLNIQWMDANNPIAMAQELKWMEEHAKEIIKKEKQPGNKHPHEDNVALEYWRVVQEWL